MFLIESFKSSSFRMTLPFVVHNSSVVAPLWDWDARPKPCLRQWYSSNLPFEWLESKSWERPQNRFFFPMQRTIFPQFSLQHWKEHRGNNSRNCRKMMKNVSLGICRVFWGDDSLCFCYISHPGQQQGHQQMRKSTWRPTCLWTWFQDFLVCIHCFGCAWSEAFGTLQWPPSRFGESCQDATWAAAASKLQLSAMASSLLLLAAARATERGPSCWSHRPQLPLLRHWSAEEPSSNQRTIFTHAFELCLQATWTLNAIFSELLLEFKALAVSLTCFALLPANPHFGPQLGRQLRGEAASAVLQAAASVIRSWLASLFLSSSMSSVRNWTCRLRFVSRNPMDAVHMNPPNPAGPGSNRLHHHRHHEKAYY